MDLTKPITEDGLKIHFGYLFSEYDFSITTNVYDANNFGNAIVILKSKALNIRIIREKGQLFFDISSPLDEEEWFDLNTVLALIDSRDDWVIRERSSVYNVAKTDQPFEISVILRNRLPVIASLFQVPYYSETKKQLMELSANWYSLALEVLPNSRDFTKDESKQYYSALRKMGKIKKVLYD